MLIVQKYGGTSVGSVERIKRVAQRVLSTQKAGHQVVVVISAMAGETNRLLNLGQSISSDATQRELDVQLATGEQAAIALVAMAINAIGGNATTLTGYQARVLTDSAFGRARIRHIDTVRFKHALAQGVIPVVAGFQGVDAEGNITTLGRGGSDTSAVAVAASLKADCCEIYTDVDGVYTTDPNICPDAKKIRQITYQEMMELASLGAKVLQIRSVELASNHNVPLHVRSSFNDEEGTMVTDNNNDLEQLLVTGVSLDTNQTRITIEGLPWRAGIQAAVFKPLGDAGVVVDMIVQNPPTKGTTNLSFTVPQTDLKQTLQLTAALKQQHTDIAIQSDDKVAKVSIVGVGMQNHAGVAQKMFELLAAEGIEILMISTSEIKVSCIIPRKYAELAVRSLHDGFICAPVAPPNS